MRNIRSRFHRGMLIVAALVTLAMPVAAETPRIITLGGDITETVYALGAGDAVVAGDTSSVYPAATEALPKVGYQRQLTAEGVLALSPTLIIASEEAGPPAAIEQLRGAGVRVETVANEHSAAGAAAKIRRVAALLDQPAAGEALVARMTEALADARRQQTAGTPPVRVLFVYARGGGSVFVSGRGTAADAMIRLAGGENAVTGVDGFSPLTAEAVVAAAPDVVLALSRGIDSLGGAAALWAQPGLAQTPAAAAQRLIVMDDLYLLGFGPRLGEAVADLGGRLRAARPAAAP